MARPVSVGARDDPRLRGLHARYYNNEGQHGGPGAWTFVGYPMGPSAYFAYLDESRSRGDFEGLAFR